MSGRTGRDAQVGYAIETSFGVFTAPTGFTEFTEESLSRSEERMESASIRPGQRVLRNDDWDPGRIGVEGGLNVEVPDRGSHDLWRAIVGGAAPVVTQPDSVNAPNVYQRVYTLGDLDGISLSLQIGRPGVGGVVHPFSYLGCKVNEWELSASVDEYAQLSYTLDGREESLGEALAAPSYDDSRPLPWHGTTVSVDGGPANVMDASLSGGGGLKTDRYFLGDRLKKEQLEGVELRGLSGELSGEFEDPVAYQRFIDGAIAAVQFNIVGGLIEATYNYGVVIDLPSVRTDGNTPNVGGPDVVEQTLGYKVTDNGVDEPITITVTDDTP